MRTNINSSEEKVIVILSDKDVVGIVRKDPVSRKNVFHRCDEMSFEEISALLGGSLVDEPIGVVQSKSGSNLPKGSYEVLMN